MCRLLLGVIVALGSWTVVAAEEARTTVAITAAVAQGDQSPEAVRLLATMEFVGLALQDDPRVAIVERRQLSAALQEQLLQRAGLTEDGRRSLGRLLTAEYLVGLKSVAAANVEAAKLIELRVVEARTGAIRGIAVAPADAADPEEAGRQFASYFQAALSAPRGAAITVAVAPFDSRGRFDRLRPLEFGLRDLITARLLELNGTVAMDDKAGIRAPAFQVLQRTDLGALQRELDLIRSGFADAERLPDALPTRASSHLVRGTIDEQIAEGERWLIVTGELVSALTARPVHEFSLRAKPDELLARLTEAVDRLAGWLSAGDLAIAASGKRRERIETEPLLRQTLADLSRFHRRSPIDFGYHDLFIPPTLRATGPQPAYVAADSVLGRHLLKKAADRLDTILYIQPDSAIAAAALGFCHSFHVDGVRNDDRAAELLQQAFDLDRTGRIGAGALSFLPEIAFHHDRGQIDAEQRGVTVDRAWLVLRSMPAAHRDYRWARLLELIAGTADDGGQLARLWPEIATYVEAFEGPERRALVSQAAKIAARVVSLSAESPMDRDAAMDRLHRWADSMDFALIEPATRTLGRIAEQERRLEEAAKWYRQGSERLADSPETADRLARQNLLMHAVRNYRAANQPQTALDLLLTLPVPMANATLHRGQYGLELGQCYEALGRPAEARDEYIAAAEANPSIVDNSDIVQRIVKLGGVPLRDDRDIDVRTVRGPVGPYLATDGQRLFIGQLAAAGTATLHMYDIAADQWSVLSGGPRSVTALAWDDGRLWVGSENQGLWRCDVASGKWTTWSAAEGLPDPHVQTLAVHDRVAFVSVGTTASGGIVRIDADDRVHVEDGPLAPRAAPTQIVLTSTRLLARTHREIHERPRTGGDWSRSEAAPPSRVTPAIAPDVFAAGDTVWASNYGRELFLFDGDTQTNRRFESAWFPAGRQKAGYRLTFVSERGDDVWFAGDPWERFQSAGLYRLNRQTGAFVKFGPRDGFPPHLTRIHAGVWIGEQLWLATSAGVCVVTPR
jgi:tetratricopeptide (TPR) repeat protein